MAESDVGELFRSCICSGFLCGIKNYSEVLINYTNALAHAERGCKTRRAVFRHFPIDKPQHVVATIGPARIRAQANCISAHSPLKNIAVSIMSLKLCLTPKPDDIVRSDTHSIRMLLHHLILYPRRRPLCCRSGALTLSHQNNSQCHTAKTTNFAHKQHTRTRRRPWRDYHFLAEWQNFLRSAEDVQGEINLRRRERTHTFIATFAPLPSSVRMEIWMHALSYGTRANWGRQSVVCSACVQRVSMVAGVAPAAPPAVILRSRGRGRRCLRGGCNCTGTLHGWPAALSLSLTRCTSTTNNCCSPLALADDLQR